MIFFKTPIWTAQNSVGLTPGKDSMVAQLQLQFSQLLLSTPTNASVAVTSSRIEQSSWNMDQIKAEWFLFHIMYVTQLFFFRTYDSFC